MQCSHCQKSIHAKPWNHLTNILDWDEEGTEKYTDKYICGYICYRRLKENNSLPNNLWQHIVNKEDYEGLISPVINKNKEFQYLTHREIQNMDIEEREKYYNERDEQIVLNPEYLEIQKELEMEDMRTAEIEDYSISSDNDDY
tara:strand:+ start:1776 stop:2204 length:429 start_codon:yes stop_codon:yes gene_type:complete